MYVAQCLVLRVHYEHVPHLSMSPWPTLNPMASRTEIHTALSWREGIKLICMMTKSTFIHLFLSQLVFQCSDSMFSQQYCNTRLHGVSSDSRWSNSLIMFWCPSDIMYVCDGFMPHLNTPCCPSLLYWIAAPCKHVTRSPYEESQTDTHLPFLRTTAMMWHNNKTSRKHTIGKSLWSIFLH